jgi:predicted O-methyltransferase YrrM
MQKKDFGYEHYKLFCSISKQINNKKILEIGTHHGNSAVAFGFGKLFENNIYIKTFDIINLINDKCKKFMDKYNIKFELQNIFNYEYREINKNEILSFDIIYIDIDPHNGILEYEMYNWLKINNFKGIIIFDDIKLGLDHQANNYETTSHKMSDFWDKIPNEEKIDLTYLGHWSGTGIVYFDKINNNIIL